MKVVKHESMVVRCNLCHAENITNDLSDFKESGTYPPYAHYMCPGCGQMATIGAADMPKRLLSRLVKKVSDERGYNDRAIFEKMEPV